MSEHIDNNEHRVTLRTSDATLFDVWTVEDPVYGAMDETGLAY